MPIAQPLVKWAVEVTRLEDLPRIVRRAAKVAMTPPTGPVFISLPGDILNMEAGIDLGASTRVDTRNRPSDAVLDSLAKRMLKAEQPGRWARLLELSYDTVGYLEQNVSPRLALECFLLECRKAS